MLSLGFWALSNDCIETVILVLLWVFQSFLSLFDGSLKIFFFFFFQTLRDKKSYICPNFNKLKNSRKLSFCLELQEVPVGPHQKDSAGGGEVWILVSSLLIQYLQKLNIQNFSQATKCHVWGGGIPKVQLLQLQLAQGRGRRGYSDHGALACA